MKVYISYSKPQLVIHTNSNCVTIKEEARPGERVVIITNDNIVDVIQLFIKRNWKFGVEEQKNDLWLDLTLNDAKLEESLVFVVRSILSSYYKPFQNSEVIFHC